MNCSNAAVVREAHPMASILKFFIFLPTTDFRRFFENAVWREREILFVALGIADALVMIPFLVLTENVMSSFPAGLV